MRIPVFRAQGGATTEAPGRSIRSRMDAAPFMNAALRQGEVVGELASAVGQYAETRYKVAIENRLNESLLGADETLRTRADELAESNDYTRALDGDDPIWSRETQEVRQRLLDDIGGDVYARQQFEARFGQIEMQNRFRLRGEVDRRIQAAAAANATQSLQRLEDSIANGIDLAEIDLATRSTETAIARAAAAGGINPETATAAQRAAIARGLSRATSRLAAGSEMPINFVDNVRTALTSGDPTSLDGSGLYLYGAMQGMTLEEQMDILSGSYRTVNFMFAETQEQEIQRRMAEEFGSQLGEQADGFISDMSNGMPPSIEGMQAVINGFATYAGRMPEDMRAAVGEKVQALEYISGLTNTLNRVADPAWVRNFANDFARRGEEGLGLEGVDTVVERQARDFLFSYADRMEETIATDPIAWASMTGAMPVGNVDISATALSQGTSGLEQRVLDARAIAARYGQPVRSIFGTRDAAQLVSQIDPANFELSLGQVQSIIQGLGEYAEVGIQELEAAGLAPELVMAMDVPNFAVQRQLVQIAGVETTALRENLAERTMATDIETEISTQLADYFVAFQAGRDPNDAIKIANSMRATAQRLAFFRAGSSSESASQIAEGVIADLFPPDTNWVRQTNQLFIVPREFNRDNVQVAADRMMSEDMLRNAGIAPLDNPLFPEYVDLALNFASLSSTGIWLNNSTGDGLILHYNFDGQYLPAMLADGRPYELLFSDASAQAQAEDAGQVRTELEQRMRNATKR
jgi:hypothetical protein